MHELSDKWGSSELSSILNESWLDFTAVQKDGETVAGFVCVPCKRYSMAKKQMFSKPCTIGSKFRLGNLKRHRDIDSHLAATRALLQLRVPKKKSLKPKAAKAPSAEDLRDLFDTIRDGGSLSKGTKFMAKHKAMKGMWTLCEAGKKQLGRKLRTCVTLNLLRDESQKRLQLGFRAAGPEHPPA